MNALCKLGELVKIKTGKLDANASHDNGIYPFFTCSKEPLKINSFSYDCECVLLAGNGEFHVSYYNGKFDAYQRTYVIEPLDKKQLSVQYLYYFLKYYAQDLRNLSVGGVIKFIKIGHIKDALIPHRTLDEQQRIVDILSRAEGIVRLRREAQQKAAEIIPALFLDMFGDPATNPKGWPTALLGNSSRIIGGSTLPNGEPFVGQEGGYQLLKVGDMNLPENKIYFMSSKEWASDQQKTYSSVPANSIVFPKRGAAIATNKKRITTRPALLDPNLMAVAPDEAVITHAFLYEWFCQFDLAKISSGTTIPQLNKGDLSPLVMITPPIELQSKFQELRSSFIAVQETQRQALDIAQATFDALLAQSFTLPTAQQAAA